jgi:hypothetical protein
MTAELGQLLLAFALLVSLFYGARGLIIASFSKEKASFFDLRNSLSQTAILVSVVILITFFFY